jgi:hypothetical protein
MTRRPLRSIVTLVFISALLVACANMMETRPISLALSTDASEYVHGSAGYLILTNDGSRSQRPLNFPTFCVGLLEHNVDGEWLPAFREEHCVAVLVGYPLEPGESKQLPFTVDAERFPEAGEYRFRLGFEMPDREEVYSNTFTVR